MTSQAFLIYATDHIGGQLKAASDGIPDEVQDKKLCEGGMSPREILEHLCEVYQAVLTEAAGGKHDWGTFAVADKSWLHLNATLWSMRGKAVAAVTAEETDALAKIGCDYIITHDAYHVGQLALIRIQHESGWDPYSIYQE